MQETGQVNGEEEPKVPMAVWRQRADDLSADVSAIKARLQERSERVDQLEVCVDVCAWKMHAHTPGRSCDDLFVVYTCDR